MSLYFLALDVEEFLASPRMLMHIAAGEGGGGSKQQDSALSLSLIFFL